VAAKRLTMAVADLLLSAWLVAITESLSCRYGNWAVYMAIGSQRANLRTVVQVTAVLRFLYYAGRELLLPEKHINSP